MCEKITHQNAREKKDSYNYAILYRCGVNKIIIIYGQTFSRPLYGQVIIRLLKSSNLHIDYN